MKLQEIVFRRPKKIVQVFTNVNIYGKTEKSFEDRKDKVRWKPMTSKSGYVTGNQLYLPETISAHPDFVTCDMITMEDDNIPRTWYSSSEDYKYRFDRKFERIFNHCIDLTSPRRFEIFEIRRAELIEIHLNYGYFEVGIPARKNFKLCELKIGHPVEIRINGKTDASATSGDVRTFKEQSYVLDYIGDFEKCAILKEPFEPVIKSVPEDRKVVNLMKELW